MCIPTVVTGGGGYFPLSEVWKMTSTSCRESKLFVTSIAISLESSLERSSRAAALSINATVSLVSLLPRCRRACNHGASRCDLASFLKGERGIFFKAAHGAPYHGFPAAREGHDNVNDTVAARRGTRRSLTTTTSTTMTTTAMMTSITAPHYESRGY